jgi:hypothetical protein
MSTWTKVTLREDEFTGKKDGTATARQVYYAANDSVVATDTAMTADDGTTAVKQIGQSYSTSQPHCVATQSTPRRKTGTQFEVEVQFEAPLLGQFDGVGLLALAAQISEGDETTQEEYTRDFDDPPKLVRNAAGEPFDKGPERLNGVTVYTIRKYVNAAMRTAIRNAKRTNNSGALTIEGQSHDEDTLLLWSASFDDVPNVPDVWLATMIVKYRPEKWADVVGNFGFSELDGGDRKDITQQDSNGDDVAVPRPWPLNEDGSKKPNADDDPDMIDFWPYAQSSWAGVPLA